MSLNVCSFCGRLGKNPKITKTSGSNERVNFSIAVDRDYKNDDGTYETDWFDITMWKSAEYVRKVNLSKGDLVLVSGRMESNDWIDHNGVHRNSKTLNCSHFQLLLKNSNEKSAKDKAAEQAAANYDPNEEDDLPF